MDRFKEIRYLLDEFVNSGAKMEWTSMPSGRVIFNFEYGSIKLSIVAPEDLSVETIRAFANQLKLIAIEADLQDNSKDEFTPSNIINVDQSTIRYLQEKRKVKT